MEQPGYALERALELFLQGRGVGLEEQPPLHDQAPVGAEQGEGGLDVLVDGDGAVGAADLALSREGANSVAEAVSNAVPTVFAPYPWHHDQHQKANAQPFVDQGLARCEIDAIEADANIRDLGRVLESLMKDHPAREAMRTGLRALPQADAALEIARTAAAIASGD
jgi:UDP-N-acetylglucosamine:LPS N-acetylglucosamine transferase